MSAPTLFVLAADLTKMQVLASLDESDVGRIRPGQAVRFRVDAFPTDEFIGQRHAGSPAAHDRAERRDLSDRHRRAEPRSEAQAGNDGEREHRNRPARPTSSACRTRHCGSGRPPRSSRRSARLRRPAAPGGGRGRGTGGGTGEVPTPATRKRRLLQLQLNRRRAAARPCSKRPAAQRPPSDPASVRAPNTTPQRQRAPRGDATAARWPKRAAAARRGGRGNFAERMANMTPEERERFMERMRARGFTPPPTVRRPRRSCRQAGVRDPAQAGAQGTGRDAPAAPSAHPGRHDVRRAVRPPRADGIIRSGMAECGRQAAARPAAARHHRRPADRADSGTGWRRSRKAPRSSPTSPPVRYRQTATPPAAQAFPGLGGGRQGGFTAVRRRRNRRRRRGGQ